MAVVEKISDQAAAINNERSFFCKALEDAQKDQGIRKKCKVRTEKIRWSNSRESCTQAADDMQIPVVRRSNELLAGSDDWINSQIAESRLEALKSFKVAFEQMEALERRTEPIPRSARDGSETWTGIF